MDKLNKQLFFKTDDERAMAVYNLLSLSRKSSELVINAVAEYADKYGLIGKSSDELKNFLNYYPSMSQSVAFIEEVPYTIRSNTDIIKRETKHRTNSRNKKEIIKEKSPEETVKPLADTNLSSRERSSFLSQSDLSSMEATLNSFFK